MNKKTARVICWVLAILMIVSVLSLTLPALIPG